MSAKKKSRPAASPSPAPVTPAAAATLPPPAPEAGASGAWIDSADPRRRMIGKIVLVGVWLYVAALWLLALDQTFHWGIFGPKVPPVL
jgi:hypothetical protein